MKRRVLLYNRELHPLAGTCMLLEQEGFAVEAAISREQLISKLSEHSYDLLLMDILWEGQDATWDFIRKARKHLPAPTVVLFTSHPLEIIHSDLPLLPLTVTQDARGENVLENIKSDPELLPVIERLESPAWWLIKIQLLVAQHEKIQKSRSSKFIEVLNITPRITELLRRNPEDLRNLSPEQFELLVADRLDRMGFDLSRTGAINTPDGGIDLIATPKQRGLGSYLLATQIKHHSTQRSTSRAEVDRLLAWKDSIFRLGLLVTNTRFTQPARWLAERQEHRNFIRLRDFSDLKRWLVDNFSDEAEWCELPKSIELAPGIVIDIPHSTIPNPKTR